MNREIFAKRAFDSVEVFGGEGGKSPKRPFALIEIMVALLIIGALSGLVVQRVHRGLEESRYRRSLISAMELSCALEEYLFDSGDQPERARINWRQIAKTRPQFAPKDAFQDAWGFEWECFAPTSKDEMVRYQLTQLDGPSSEHFVFASRGLHRYLKKHPRKLKLSDESTK